MKSYSLMLLFMIVCCSLVSSEDTASITDHHDDTFWLHPFDRLSNASTFRKLESQEKDDLTFYHPDDLKLLHSRWNKNQNIIPELQTSKGRPITKFVEELFPGFKFTTPRSAKKPNQPLFANKEKVSGSRKTIEGNGSKEKISSPKPFWGPSILIPSVRPWFYTTQATRKLPFKSSLPSIDITRDHTTPDYDFHAIDGPTRKTVVSIPLEIREPSFPFWGLPIETSSTRPPLAYTKITTAANPSRTEEEFLFRLSNETVDDDPFSGPIALALEQPYDLPYNPPDETERFRDPIHLKPGPPYHDKQDSIEQNVWHATAAVTEPTIVGNPISTEPHLPQQQLEPDRAIQQQHFPGLALNSEVGFLSKEIDTTALGSYPSSYPHSIKPKPHVIYHHQPAPQQNNYYHPPSRLTHIDFSPIFLAIVPIALFLGAAAAFALASAVSSSSAVATAQQQQQQQEESSNNNNNDNNNNNNNINTILALLAAFHEVKKHHDDHHKIVIVTTTTPTPDSGEEVANEVPVTTDPPLPPPPPTGPFFIKLSSSTTESPPAPLQSYGHYERKKITYHHMNGIT